MKNIKMFGLLAVSAMALIAFVGTSSASAVSTFTSSGAGVKISSSGVPVENHVFTVEGSAVECEEIEFKGETTGASAETQTVTPTYKKCKAFGFANATVTTGTCSFTFKAATDGAGMATVNLSNCANSTEGIKIDVNAPFVARCIVDVPHQSVASAVSYTNSTPTPSTMDVTVNVTASGIMNDVTTSTGLCPLKVGTNSTGAYTGKSTVTSADNNITWSA